MNFDLKIQNNELTVLCSNSLEKFSNEFIKYYDENIERIKEELSINQEIKLIVALTAEEEKAGFVYGKTSFSGFFTDTGTFAYINLDGKKTKEDMFKGLMHELIHHLYKYYVYGKDKERITWVDEGIAQYFSGQKDDMKDDEKYKLFLEENLQSIDNINLNELNHNDRSFGDNNGYNLSYMAIRYLYENNSHEEFIKIIKNQDLLKDYGNTVLNTINERYNSKSK